MYVIAVSNQKGGVAKTTTSVNLAAGLALIEHARNPRKPKRVLLVDMDPQSHSVATASGGVFGERPELKNQMLLSNLLLDDEPPATVSLIQQGRIPWTDGQRNLDYIPTTSSTMTMASQMLVTADAREFRLAEALQPIAPLYKYIVIDTRPSLDILTINALVAASHILIPVELTALGMDSLIDVMSTVERIQKRLNPRLAIAGILPSRCNLQRVEAQEILEQLEGAYKNMVLSPIKERADVTYAFSAGLDIFSFRPPRSRDLGEIASASPAAQEFARMTDEILRTLGEA